VLWEDGR